MRKGAIVITFLLACNVVQAQQPFHRSFLFTEKDSTMRYSSEEYYTGKIKSKTLHLQQHLIINTNLTLDYDTISIYSNKQIIVQSGYTLTIQNSILYACKDMWSGIRLEPGAQLIVNNSLIMDADTAILSRSNADNTDAYGYYQLNYVTFNKNRYGIVQMPHPDLSNTHINIKGCTFDCQSNIQWSAGDNLKAPYSSQKSHTAIVMDMSIDEPVLTLGDASSGANKNNFYRHRYGIRSYGGRFTLVNSLMQYLYSTQACNAIDAVGLWHKGGHLYVQQINNLYNYFDYCKVGVLYEDGGNHSVNISGNIFTNIGNGLSCTLGQIKAIGAVWVRQSSTLNLNINSNEISFCERGIRVVNCPYSNITAKYNQIENCKYGIGIAETESSDVMVYENEINQLNLPATYGMEGINISQIVGIPASVTIENNHIRKVRSTIVGNNCGMMLIQNNQIQFPQNISGAVKYGIRINNCNDAQVLNNIILKDGAVAQYSQQNQLFGITAELCTGIRVYNNIIARCGTAIRILGDSTGGLNAEAQLKCNRMIDYFYGVRLDAAGIGAQGNETTPSDNRWEIGINNNTIGIYDYYAVSSL